MKLTVLIPVFNEESTIGKVLRNLIKIRCPYNLEIIVVNDGSTDNSLTEIKKIKSSKIRVRSNNKNYGKGSAIKSGLIYALGDFILIQDADMEYNPNEINNLLRPIINKKPEESASLAVYGSRFLHNQATIPKVYYLGNRFLTMLTNLIYGVNLTDMETGYKLIPAVFFKRNKIRSDHFDIEPEITAKLLKNGFKIIEVPISYRGRSHLAGKKLTLKDAFGAIAAVTYYRFFN